MNIELWTAWVPVISAVAVAVIANGVIALVAHWRRKKVDAEAAKADAEAGKADAEASRVDAEAADVLTGTALRIVKRMEKKVLELEAQLTEQQIISREQGKEIRVLQCRVKILEDENHDLRRGAERLVIQVEARGETPEWRPEELL